MSSTLEDIRKQTKEIGYLNFDDFSKQKELFETLEYEVYPIYKRKSNLTEKEKYYLFIDIFPLMIVLIFDIIKNNKFDINMIDIKFNILIELWNILIPNETFWIISNDCIIGSLQFFINIYKNLKEDEDDDEISYPYIVSILKAVKIILDLDISLESNDKDICISI